MMRQRIHFDNKRQMNRYSSILGLLTVTVYVMLFKKIVNSQIFVFYVFFTMLWVPGGQLILSLFETSERQFKYYNRVFFILTISICLLGYLGVNNNFLEPLTYFSLAWGIGFSKLILRRLND